MEDIWLDERQEHAWRAFHAMRIHLLGHLARRLAAQSGLSEPEYEVLVALSEAPDHQMRSRDLGRALQWQRSRLSHQLDRMVKRELVTREPCPTDARGCVAVLTTAGLRSIDKASKLHVADVRHCFADVLTPEQLDGLTVAARAITEHLAAEHSDEDPG
jgi:DNA-binding MarR family transcriptional regulator